MENAIQEWIDHHLALGIDSVRIYDNGFVPVDNSCWAEGARELTEEERANHKWKKKPDADYFEEFTDEEIADKLQAIVDKYCGLVEVVPWVYGVDHQVEYPYSQWDSIKHCAEQDPASWGLFMDPDEYLVLRLHDSIRELMEDYPKVSCFKFGQRIFDERQRDKPVREIFNWSYESAQSKNLVILDLDYSGTLDVHSITPAVGDFVRVPTDVAMYHHYRGDPLAAGGERIRGHIRTVVLLLLIKRTIP